MRRVAIGAHRRMSVALSQSFAVNACLILIELIGAQGGIETAHERGVGMAFRAEVWDFRAVDVSAEAGGRTHRLVQIIAGGIAAVAGRTIHLFLRVDAGIEIVGFHLERRIELGMAVQAAVLDLRLKARRDRKEKETAQEKRKESELGRFSPDAEAFVLS
jgi:hypothetical protein